MSDDDDKESYMNPVEAKKRVEEQRMKQLQRKNSFDDVEFEQDYMDPDESVIKEEPKAPVRTNNKKQPNTSQFQQANLNPLLSEMLKKQASRQAKVEKIEDERRKVPPPLPPKDDTVEPLPLQRKVPPQKSLETVELPTAPPLPPPPPPPPPPSISPVPQPTPPSQSTITTTAFAPPPSIPAPSAINIKRSEDDDLKKYDYYLENVTREEASKILKQINENGVFIVRNKEGVPSQPYSMSLLYNNEVSNLEIRKLDANKWAIGKPKETETFFNSVPEIIQHYTNNLLGIANKGAIKLKMHAEIKKRKQMCK